MQFEFDIVGFVVLISAIVANFVYCREGVKNNAEKIRKVEVDMKEKINDTEDTFEKRLKEFSQKNENDLRGVKQAIESKIDMFKSHHDDNSKAIWENFKNFQLSLNGILQGLSRIEGELRARYKDEKGNN